MSKRRRSGGFEDSTISLKDIPEELLEKRKRQIGDVGEINMKAPVRRATNKDSEITLRVRTLNADFTCPICLGIMRDTMTVMECLHRFCRECIEMSIRMGRKQCPSCRVKVPTKRSLRRDIAFDSLIQQIYPDIDEVVEAQESEIKKLLQGHNHSAFALSVKEGTKRQDAQRRTRVVLPSQQASAQEFKKAADQRAKPDTDLIDLCMQPDDVEEKKLKLPKLDRRYLRTTRKASITIMKAYLAKKLERNGPFRISVKNPKQGEVKTLLADDLTLEDVHKSFGSESDRPYIELFYSLEPGMPPSSSSGMAGVQNQNPNAELREGKGD
uniref:RING-type E3 ubiquitin transferase n=1 Tax=Lotharella globosa TaxID=91324 RepID=A0A7S3Z9M5_9EUKA|mmetsp:Transcript_2827/g.5409  ORF Transcript_2827/g.5409 Transcript_2827/m.5409 type:complete len:326 (+) Transcript_2827:31-1008(+)